MPNRDESTVAPPVLSPKELDVYSKVFDKYFSELTKNTEPYILESGRVSVTQDFMIGDTDAFSLARKHYFGEDEEELDDENTNKCVKFAKFLILISWINDPYGVEYKPKPVDKSVPSLADDIQKGIELEQAAAARLRAEIERARRRRRRMQEMQEAGMTDEEIELAETLDEEGFENSEEPEKVPEKESKEPEKDPEKKSDEPVKGPEGGKPEKEPVKEPEKPAPARVPGL